MNSSAPTIYFTSKISISSDTAVSSWENNINAEKEILKSVVGTWSAMCSVEIEDSIQLWKESALLDLWADILKIILFTSIHFCLCCVFIAAQAPLAVVCGLLIAMESCPRAQALDLRLSSWGHGLSCSAVRGLLILTNCVLLCLASRFFPSEPPGKPYGLITLSNYSRQSNIFERLVKTGCNLYTSFFILCDFRALLYDCFETKYGYDWTSFIMRIFHIGKIRSRRLIFKNINRPILRRHLLLTLSTSKDQHVQSSVHEDRSFLEVEGLGRFNTVCFCILSRKHDVVGLWGALIFLWISFPGDHKTFILHVYIARFWKILQLPKLSWE